MTRTFRTNNSPSAAAEGGASATRIPVGESKPAFRLKDVDRSGGGSVIGGAARLEEAQSN